MWIFKVKTKNREDLFKKEITIQRALKSDEDLFSYEKYLIDWFFNEEQTTSSMVKDRINNLNEAPCERFSIFQALVLLSFPINLYYRKSNNKIERIIYIYLVLLSGIYIFFHFFK